ncbi:MAG: hypothetical protein MJ016_07795 [Victivallaceae bacterium]|nr:hypothetical protein [Victivallaceae bacterium]
MKKILLILTVAATTAFSARAFSMNDIYWWLPNRIADLTDIVSLGGGLCLGLKAEARVTRAIDFSQGGGCFWVLRKDYNRHLTAALEKGYHFNFLCLGTEDYTVDAVRGVQPWFFPADGEAANVSRRYFDYQYNWFSNPANAEYDLWEGSRDWWEIAVEAGCLGYVRVAVHPIEVFDFIGGIFFIDFKHDDVD